MMLGMDVSMQDTDSATAGEPLLVPAFDAVYTARAL
jgi:hypothetical protein